jgi:hypothetical protein
MAICSQLSPPTESGEELHTGEARLIEFTVNRSPDNRGSTVLKILKNKKKVV